MAVFLFPLARFPRAFKPTAVFLSPVSVPADKAAEPTAVFSVPVVAAFRALNPTAVFSP